MDTEKFFVYDNKAMKYSRIHKGNCSFCKNGEGFREKTTDSTQWHGPFATYAEALEKMQSLGYDDAGDCTKCNPSAFFVYDNFAMKHTKIHRGNCSFCKSGAGRNEASGDSTQWFGPFATYAEALEKMQSLDYKDTGDCTRCTPSA